MRRAAVAVALAVALVGCSDQTPAAGPAASPSDERRSGVLDGVELALEVADTVDERAVGLMGRTSVPAGTGMVFLYDEPTNGAFYMYMVPIPLLAVFINDGRVVSSVVMPPCEQEQPGDCPTYGADRPFDTVVETDPATLPDVAPGDTFVLAD